MILNLFSAPEKPKGNKDIRDLFGSPENSNKKSDKPGAKNHELPPNVRTIDSQSDTDQDSDRGSTHDIPQRTSSFPGQGNSLGWTVPSQGPIVRRIPGIGLISSARPSSSQASATITSLASQDGVATLSDNDRVRDTKPTGNVPVFKPATGALKRPFEAIFSDSDSNEDILFPIQRPEKKQRTGPFDHHGLTDFTSPGRSVRIPGFKSVSNKQSKPSVQDSRAADRNRRAMELSSSEESDTDDVPLSSAIQRARASSNCDSDSGAAFVDRDDSTSPIIPNINREVMMPDSPPASNDSFMGAVSRVIVPGPTISIPSADILVECPVCQTKVLNSQINAHLDSCMS